MHNDEFFQTQVLEAQKKLFLLQSEIHKKVIGQRAGVESMMLALLSGGHILLEGVPGLAKTLAVESLSKALSGSYARLQFTPDLLPSDVVGSDVFDPKTQQFHVHLGPIFQNIVLVDEINRAPSKVQSALLEAMAESKVSLSGKNYSLPEVFIVLATQNPLEQSGTYPLPEAQLDRFLLKSYIDYPTRQEEISMYEKVLSPEQNEIQAVLSIADIIDMKKMVENIYVSSNIFTYVYDMVEKSRDKNDSFIAQYVQFGISPRGGLAWLQVAKAYALLQGRTFVIPEDVKKVAKEVSAHRLVLSYQSYIDSVTAVDVVQYICEQVKVS